MSTEDLHETWREPMRILLMMQAGETSYAIAAAMGVDKREYNRLFSAAQRRWAEDCDFRDEFRRRVAQPTTLMGTPTEK